MVFYLLIFQNLLMKAKALFTMRSLRPLCHPVNYGLYPFFLVYTTLTTTIRRRQRVQERMEGKDNARDIRDQFLVKNDVVMAPDKFHENA